MLKKYNDQFFVGLFVILWIFLFLAGLCADRRLEGQAFAFFFCAMSLVFFSLLLIDRRD